MNEKQLRDLVGFITFAIKEEMREGEILSTIIHDLAGLLKNEPGFSPRSWDYSKYCQI